ATLTAPIHQMACAMLLRDPVLRSQRLNELLHEAYLNAQVEDRPQLGAALFAASCFAAQNGHIEQAKITRQILHLDPSTVSRLCRLREIWETLEVADSAEALTLAESNDVALRAVGAWFNVPQPSTKSQLLTKLERTR